MSTGRFDEDKQVTVDELLKLLSEHRWAPPAPPPTSPPNPRRARRPPPRRLELPEAQVKTFNQLASKQRGEPEHLMEVARDWTGGGSLAYVIEHVGDIIHRISEKSDWYGYSAGRGYALDKAESALGKLWNPTFTWEVERFARAAAEARGMPYAKWERRLDQALADYADAHARLPVYNRAQWLARAAAVALGRKEWAEARHRLQQIIDLAKDPDAWWMAARSFVQTKSENKGRFA